MKLYFNCYRHYSLLLTFSLFIQLTPLQAQNAFTMQRWTGAWGSDGPIHTGDLNADGRTDVFMWRQSDNSWTVNLSTGSGFTMQRWTGAWGSDGPIHTGDLNGDRKTDVFMWRQSDNSWTINLSTGSGFIMQRWTGAWGSDGPINTGDLNGDGKTDVFMWRKSDNSWTINLSTGSGFAMQRWTGAWGSDGPINTGDLNGDGKTDVFMWRQSDNSWTINLSSGSGFAMQRWTGAWGSDGPIHTGDVNGDGKTDVFMWRQSDNSWTLNLSTGEGFRMDRWLGACKNDFLSKTGDFNGDRRTDVAIWNQTNNKWMINFSMGNGFNLQEFSGAWGSDGPVNTGDLNGDGRTDILMWRASDNSWTVNISPSIQLSNTTNISDCSPTQPVVSKAMEFFDISPDTKNGTVGGNATAGLIINMAGDKNGLYAVSLNAGVWKTEINADRGFGKWRQLPNSPRYASCIAVDPQLPGHIAVGERDGDASSFGDNKCGLWESYDGGQTFDPAYYYDPSKNMCSRYPSSHAITAVIITNKSTTILASPCGISRKQYLGGAFTKVLTGDITAISNFRDLIVARSQDSIFISDDDGVTWNERHKIETKYTDASFSTGSYSEGRFSVAIIQPEPNQNVFVYVPATRTTNDPNMSSILIFNRGTKKWKYQNFTPGLGTGLGGRAFIKSFYLDVNTLAPIVGGKNHLVFCAAQDISRANSIRMDGTVEWKLSAVSGGSDAPDKKFHSDIWDYLIDPVGWYNWVSNDGGIYYQKLNENDPARFLNAKTTDDWMNLNEGLHTHHIHAVVAGSALPGGEIYDNSKLFATDRIAYSTSDNQAWKNGDLNDPVKAVNNWVMIGGMGDVNYSFMDARNNALTLNVRNFDNAAALDDFGGTAPSGSSLGNLNISQTIAVSGQQGFSFVQTLKRESVSEHLDAMMLVNLPLTYGSSGQTVTGTLGLASGQNPVLIRNRAFARNPSTMIQNISGWEIQYNDIPAGTMGFWVSGGHQNPTVFVLRSESGGSRIYRRKTGESSWQPMPSTPSPIIGLAQFGPVFVNPYDPDVVYVSCNDGVYLYDKLGDRFTKDDALTNLVSGNGMYPVNTVFGGGKGGGGEYTILANRCNAMGPVSSMAFNPENPTQVACSSPFTGVFYKDGSKPWKDLSGMLPKPYTSISSLAMTSNAIYIATEGRGVLMIKNPQ